MIKVFPGKSNSRRPVSTGYLIDGKVAIDAPEGVIYPNPELIILTHEHCDHITGIPNHSCEIAASPAAIKEIDMGHSFCRELGLPEIKDAKIRPLKDGERLQFPNFTLRILHTPGHCPGAICIYLEEKKYLFSGDTVFPDLMLPNLSLPGSDPSKLLKSYEMLSKLKIEKFFPGHGEPFSSSGYMEKVKDELCALMPGSK
ncbi:MAG: MBL fold metallo-hydrolase [Candidatus Micrarchaeia archaeon]|jgi:glyoxylase-like metal-dependent hydrolase (beta-lactamase superfamily II)